MCENICTNFRLCVFCGHHVDASARLECDLKKNTMNDGVRHDKKQILFIEAATMMPKAS